MAATVTPIRPGVVPVERGVVQYAVPLTLPLPPRPCPVCAVVIVNENGDHWHCTGCSAWIHGECYWGRVASMAEWLEFQRQLNRDDTPFDYCPQVMCGACRGKEGA
jgi:hypothetical protein